MKRGLILGIAFISLFLISFASALSLSETLSFIDPTFITLGLLFVIIFALLNFSLSKVFRDKPAVSIIVAISMALLAVYWINNFLAVGTLFSNLGVSDEILYTVGPILFLALIIFLLVKIRFGVFAILGGILILGGVTGLIVYSSDILTIVGIVFIIIGIFGMFSKRGRMRSLLARYNRIYRRNPSDIRLRNLLYKINRLKPGFGQIKP